METRRDTERREHEDRQREHIRNAVFHRRRHQRFVDVDEVIMTQRFHVRERFYRRQHRHLRVREARERETEHGVQSAYRQSVTQRRQQTDQRDTECFHREDEEEQTEHQPRRAAIDRKARETIQDDVATDAEHDIDERVRNEFADHSYGVVAACHAQPGMRRPRLEFETDREDRQHQTDQSEDTGQNRAYQIDGVVSPWVSDHMSLDSQRLDTVHDNIVRQTFLPQHLALESTGDEVRHGQHLLVRRVAADGIGVGNVEIDLRSFERHELVVETLRDDEDTVNLTLLHGLPRLGVRVRDEPDIDRRCRLHLVYQSP